MKNHFYSASFLFQRILSEKFKLSQNKVVKTTQKGHSTYFTYENCQIFPHICIPKTQKIILNFKYFRYVLVGSGINLFMIKKYNY